jgi:hypothetical protein
MPRTDKDALIEIGNLIGAPTMDYSPEYARRELEKRIQQVGRIIVEQLGLVEPKPDPEKFRRNPGLRRLDKPFWP